VLLHSREVERLAEIGRWSLGQRYKAGACYRLGCKCRQDGGGLSALSNYGAIVAREEVDSVARFLQMTSSLAFDATIYDERSGRRYSRPNRREKLGWKRETTMMEMTQRCSKFA